MSIAAELKGASQIEGKHRSDRALYLMTPEKEALGFEIPGFCYGCDQISHPINDLDIMAFRSADKLVRIGRICLADSNGLVFYTGHDIECGFESGWPVGVAAASTISASVVNLSSRRMVVARLASPLSYNPPPLSLNHPAIFNVRFLKDI